MQADAHLSSSAVNLGKSKMQTVPSIPFEVIDGPRRSVGTIAHTPFTIGRLPDRDLILEDVHVSRKHAEVVYDHSAFYVIDNGSRHGTFVNGVRVQRQRLSAHDLLHFGTIDGPKLRFDTA